MTIFLGFLTALGVALWGMRWYLQQTDRSFREWWLQLRQPARAPAPEAPPLVPHEAAEQLIQPKSEAPAPEGPRPAPRPSLPAPPRAALPPGEEAEERPAEQVMGHCPRCATQRVVLNPTQSTTRKGRPALRGQCAVCGSGLFVFTDDEGESTEEEPPA